MNLVLLFLFSWVVNAQTELLESCKQHDLIACEKLGAYYMGKAEWEKGFIVGEALCAKDIVMGCTFAGTSLLAQGKGKEGHAYLTQACDKFEPYACRSLARLMRKNKQDLMSYMYMRRACSYGLKESCADVRKPSKAYSSAGLALIKKITEGGDVGQLNGCPDPLTKEDCLLIPGFLSIYFRARLMQAEAKLSLSGLLAAEKAQKEYSYDFSKVMKDHKPLENYHYVYGFMRECAKKYEKEKRVQTNSQEVFPSSYEALGRRTRANAAAYFSKGKAQDCYDPAGGFEAYAVASLDPLNPTRLDVWKINQDGNLLQVQDGLPLP